MADAPSQEVRQDRITQQWVICAPTRGHRPHDVETEAPSNVKDDTPVEGCPFCPGHEDMLPDVLWEREGRNGAPWATRAVPNKYPALTPNGDAGEQACGLYTMRGGHGRQEVVIDTPYHHQSMAYMSTGRLKAVLDTYWARYRALREDGLIPFVFRNHGADAGASLPHPHSQIIAPSLRPPTVAQEEQQARARYTKTGRCPYCEMLDEELSAEARIVYTNDVFVVLIPYAASVPFAQWIVPRTHEPEMGRLDEDGRLALADALRQAIRRLHHALGDPDYNFFFRTALDHASEAEHLHWTLRIHPRTTVQAGFELGTGVNINPSLPERDAEVLRSV